MFTAKRINGLQDVLALLNCRRLPGRLTTGEAAALPGSQQHDIAPLIAAKLVVPLGKPAANAPKYFCAVDVTAFGQDREWLSRATRSLASYWAGKNRRRKEERRAIRGRWRGKNARHKGVRRGWQHEGCRCPARERAGKATACSCG